MLAGETSGDGLAAGLMRALRERVPEVEFHGVGGPAMQAAGLNSLADWQLFHINGFREPVRRLPQLLSLLSFLRKEFLRLRLDVFVGIDFNVFNLRLEKKLREQGIPVVHYVSPSVYAWRRWRVKSIAEAADRVLTLFPFEPALYCHQPVDAVFVGHPLADEINPAFNDGRQTSQARIELGLENLFPSGSGSDAPASTSGNLVIALMPGSRSSEIRLLADLFLSAALLFQRRFPNTVFLLPLADVGLKSLLESHIAAYPELNLRLICGKSRQVLAACDGVLCKAGTSTLEALLLSKPMVVSYRLGALGYVIAHALMHTPWVALPNILAQQTLVPELLQHGATPEALAQALEGEIIRFHTDPSLARRFDGIHRQLRQQANETAASAVLDLLPQLDPLPQKDAEKPVPGSGQNLHANR